MPKNARMKDFLESSGVVHYGLFREEGGEREVITLGREVFTACSTRAAWRAARQQRIPPPRSALPMTRQEKATGSKEGGVVLEMLQGIHGAPCISSAAWRF